MNHIAGIVFDLDDTLVTSKLNYLAIKKEIGCPAEADCLAFIDSLPSTAEKHAAMAIIHRHEMLDAQQSHWISGAKQFVEACSKDQIPMAIVTRNSRNALHLKVSNNHIPIEFLSSREDAPPKPSPIALLAIAKAFRLRPDQILMIGDYKYDLEAASRAGMLSCLINFQTLPEFADQADYVFPDFERLSEAFFGTRSNATPSTMKRQTC